MSNWYCDNLECDWSGETNPTTLHGFCPKCLANCSKAVQKCPINGTVYHPKHKAPFDHPEASSEQLTLVLRGGEFQLSFIASLLICYECDRPVGYLFDDGRCGRCTRLTPEEVSGSELSGSVSDTPTLPRDPMVTAQTLSN